ncbi:hypothetical protein V5O48_003238 [Marasmius crinis-equi]|uniref:MYND-type domain-containing protein n=1 Tax=Marasmius crinis-equi TaxID=585013 RepID=A0ABR3FTT0_9AGAR
MFIHEILNHPFVRQSSDCFPTVKSATDNLRRLGRQIPSQSVGRFYPPDTLLWKMVEIFAALSKNIRGRNGSSASAQVVKDWKSAIWPWLKFLLIHAVLSSTETSTRLRFEALEHTLMFVPPLLAFNDSQICLDSQTAVIQATPELPLLITRIWCKLVAENHPTWGIWSLTVMAVVHVLPNNLSLLTSSVPNDRRRHETNVTLGRQFIRHIYIQTERLATMSIEGLTDLKSFLQGVTLGLLFQDPGPLALEKIQGSSVAALSSLACRVISKHTVLQKADADSEECQLMHDIAIVVLSYLELIANDAYYISLVLEAGFIKALFKSHRCLFQFEAKRPAWNPSPSLSHYLCQIIDQISKFMLYSSVVHQFSRAERRYLNEGSLKVLRSKSPAVWNSLKLAATKAARCRDIRRTMRESDLSFMCSNDLDCPLKTSDGVLEHRTPFLRCSACLNSTYCSRECQKIHWDNGHRGSCAEKARRWEHPRVAFLDEHEWRLFNGIARQYYEENQTHIKQQLGAFLLDLSKRNRAGLSNDDKLVAERKKNPIVFLDFDRSASPVPKDTIRLFGLCAFVNHFQGKATWLHKAVEEWRGPGTDGNLTLVVAFFPGKEAFPIAVRLAPQQL